jgi:cytidine deaminase
MAERVRVADLDGDWQALVAAATAARAEAYTPYSGFGVGAAGRTADGRVYTGANIENAAYGLTVCAERVAIWKAVSEGHRRLAALALVTETGSSPCGSCRQVMGEFARELPVLIADTAGNGWLTSLAELLPLAFSAQDLDEAT